MARLALFCDEWAQASHGGELTGAVEAGLVHREDVTDLGRVLTGEAPGRPGDDAVTLFDSTGLAIQDLGDRAGRRRRRSARAASATCRRPTGRSGRATRAR